MTTVRQIYEAMQAIAPLELAEHWDNPGLLVDCGGQMHRVLAALDITPEVVAEAAAGMLAGVEAPRVLDLCAGTGCLGLGVKRFCPAAQVTSLEKSPAAYRYLEQNAHLSPALTITPVQGDLFTYWQTLPEGQLDLIVSNPPYLTAAEMGALQPEVAQEPAMALEAGEDGLVFYRAIAEHYQKALRPGGALALEIGWQQREAVTALLAANGWTEITCRKDFGGNDRCVMARKQ
jgi:release factor glutamine methyltransferase